MLQQTRVETVVPYFERWVTRFPGFESLAQATEEEVLGLWQGLGYYSRARNLLALAKGVVRAGKMPKTAEEWQSFPGVGPYTAAAVSSLAFNDHAAVVDGNVVRVFARVLGDGKEYPDRASAVRVYAAVARDWLPRGWPGEFNEALMEIGATVCRVRQPLCLVCPLRGDCRAAALGEPEAYPRFRERARIRRTVARIWWVRDGAVLLARTTKGKRLAGLWEIPTAEVLGDLEAGVGEVFAVRRRSIGREDLTEEFHLPAEPGGEGRDPVPPEGWELRWWTLDDLESVSLSGPHRRWIDEFLLQPGMGTP